MAGGSKFCLKLASRSLFSRNIRTINFTNDRKLYSAPISVYKNYNKVLLDSLRCTRSCRYSSSTDNSKQNTVAGSLAQDILAAKVKEENKNKSSDQNDADEKYQKEQQENQRRALKFSFIAFGTITIGSLAAMINAWGAPPVDEDGMPTTDEFSNLPMVEQYLRRTYKEMRLMRKSIKEPSREKLLPDPLSGKYIQPPYTLVLEMKDVLVHPEWTYSNGWRFKKRPGLEYLLQHCAPPLFEIVVYTCEQAMTAYHVVDQLDRNGFIWYKLYKDSTNYIDGKHVKELGRLNRDLKRVIMVDWDTAAVSDGRNQLKLVRWDGSMDDQGLTSLADLLRTIAESEVDDVRDVLDYYRQFPDPLAAYEQFKFEAQTQELQKKEEEQKKRQSDAFKAPKSWTPSFLKW